MGIVMEILKDDKIIIDDNKLWQRYFQNRDLATRNKLVERYTYVVKIIAMKIWGIYHQYGDVEDIVNEGIIALIDAVGRFDISKDIKFETYASIKIRGAIIDYVRKQAWSPRRVNKNRKLIESAEGELRLKLGRSPSEQEIADYLKIDISEYSKIVFETSNSSLLSFEELISELSYKYSATSDDLTPEDSYEKLELKNVLTDAIDQLEEKEKIIISLYYKEDLKIKDIADVMQLSNSRVSQIHSQALSKLNNIMRRYIKGL